MLMTRDFQSGVADDEPRPNAFRIAVPSFGMLRDRVAPLIDGRRTSREEILELFSDRLRPGNGPDPRYTASEVHQTDVARRLRRALYPKD